MPERADLVYVYRPLTELPEIVALAQRLGAKAIWIQSGLAPDGTKDVKGCWHSDSGLQQARNAVESAGPTGKFRDPVWAIVSQRCFPGVA